MVKHNVKCLWCNEQFDANAEEFVVEGRRYLHKECYNKYKEKQDLKEKIHLLVKSHYGSLYSKNTVDKQIKEMLDDGKSLLEIYKALYYWYDIKKSDPKNSYGSIRIVNYILDEANNYYRQQEKNKEIRQSTNLENIKNPEIKEFHFSQKPIKKPVRVKLFKMD